MSPKPTIFTSAVSRELRNARQLMANTPTFLGYEPVWQDILGTETGDLGEMLRQQIYQCKGLVQLVGQCYRAEPPKESLLARAGRLNPRDSWSRGWRTREDSNFKPSDP
jgi:hypothetical protein